MLVFYECTPLKHTASHIHTLALAYLHFTITRPRQNILSLSDFRDAISFITLYWVGVGDGFGLNRHIRLTNAEEKKPGAPMVLVALSTTPHRKRVAVG